MPRRVRFQRKYVRAGRIILCEENDGTPGVIEVEHRVPLQFKDNVQLLQASVPSMQFGDYTIVFHQEGGKKQLLFQLDGTTKFIMSG